MNFSLILIFSILPGVSHINSLLNFELLSFKTGSEHSRGFNKFLNTNFKPISRGVPELWLGIHTNKQTKITSFYIYRVGQRKCDLRRLVQKCTFFVQLSCMVFLKYFLKIGNFFWYFNGQKNPRTFFVDILRGYQM